MDGTFRATSMVRFAVYLFTMRPFPNLRMQISGSDLKPGSLNPQFRSSRAPVIVAGSLR
jgi:hypothetical protein